MIRGRLRMQVPLAALLLVGSAAIASADPISLVTGGIFYSRQNAAAFRASSGDGNIEIISEFGSMSESRNPAHACFQCTPGSTLNLSQSESIKNLPEEDLFAVGSVRVGNVDYWFDTLDFTITAGNVIVPDTSGDRIATVRAGNFLFSGVINATTDAGISRRFDFVGSGDASITFLDTSWFQTSYQFADAAAVPEPGTFFLLGTGAAALIQRKRRRS